VTPRTRSLLLQSQLLVVARPHGPWEGEGEGGGVVAGVWWPRRSRGFAYPADPRPYPPRLVRLLSLQLHLPSWLSSPLPSSAGVSQPGQIRFALLWLGYRTAAPRCAGLGSGVGVVETVKERGRGVGAKEGDAGFFVDRSLPPPSGFALCSCSSAVSRLIGWVILPCPPPRIRWNLIRRWTGGRDWILLGAGAGARGVII